MKSVKTVVAVLGPVIGRGVDRFHQALEVVVVLRLEALADLLVLSIVHGGLPS